MVRGSGACLTDDSRIADATEVRKKVKAILVQSPFILIINPTDSGGRRISREGNDDWSLREER